MWFLSSLSPSKIPKDLHQGGEASTFERLTSSRHVADLRLIFLITLVIMAVGFVIATILCFYGSLPLLVLLSV
jgi:hypothetical protein